MTKHAQPWPGAIPFADFNVAFDDFPRLPGFLDFPGFAQSGGPSKPRAHQVVEVSDDEISDEEFTLIQQKYLKKDDRRATLDNLIDLTSDSDEDAPFQFTQHASPKLPLPAKRKRIDSPLRDARPLENQTTPSLRAQVQPTINLDSPTTPHISHDRFHDIPSAAGQPFVQPGPAYDTYLSVVRDKSDKGKQKAESLAPYYFDPDLQVSMYRGKGYERYPIVLGTINEHHAICNKWKAAHQRRIQKQAANLLQVPDYMGIRMSDSSSESDSDSDSDHEDNRGTQEDQMCLAAVLEIFPDIQHRFVMDKIRKHPLRKGTGRMRSQLCPSDATLQSSLVSQLLELASYPKEPRPSEKEKLPEDGTGKTVLWDKTTPRDTAYLKDAVLLLANVFDHIPTCHIHKIVHETKSIFDTYIHLEDIERQFHSLPERPYARLRLPRVGIEKKYQVTVRDRRFPLHYAARVNELQAAKQHVARQRIRENTQDVKDKAEQLNLDQHLAIGAIGTCGCCFDEEIPLNRLIACNGDTAHAFCFDCVSGLAGTQVGLMKYEMKCMDEAACSADLPYSAVAKAVDTKTFDRLEFNKQQAEILAAELEGLEQCPFCDFKAICDDVEVDPVFGCKNPECRVSSCRRCQMVNHLPKTCEENRQETDLSALHRVEEARSEAVMRTCPKCKVKIIKIDGCNRMTCSTCNTSMCYECQRDISNIPQHGYDHFHAPGATCKLYDRAGIDRHEVEADEAEEEAIRQAQAEDANVDVARLRVDTGRDKTRRTALEQHPAHDEFEHQEIVRNERFRHATRRIRATTGNRRAPFIPAPQPHIPPFAIAPEQDGIPAQMRALQAPTDPTLGSNADIPLAPAIDAANDPAQVLWPLDAGTNMEHDPNRRRNRPLAMQAQQHLHRAPPNMMLAPGHVETHPVLAPAPWTRFTNGFRNGLYRRMALPELGLPANAPNTQDAAGTPDPAQFANRPFFHSPYDLYALGYDGEDDFGFHEIFRRKPRPQ